MSAKKMRKATAVQITERPSTEPTTFAEGIASGPLTDAIGTYTRAVTPSETAITPSPGASVR